MNRSVRVPAAPPAPPDVGSAALPLPAGISAEQIVKTTWKNPVRVGHETRQLDSRGYHFRSPPQPETYISKMAAPHPDPIQGTKLPDGTSFHPTQQFDVPPSMRHGNSLNFKYKSNIDTAGLRSDARVEVQQEVITEAMPDVQLPHSVENTVLYVPEKKNCKVRGMFSNRFEQNETGDWVDTHQANINARAQQRYLDAHQKMVQADLETDHYFGGIFDVTVDMNQFWQDDEEESGTAGRQTIVTDVYTGEQLVAFNGKFYPRTQLEKLVGKDKDTQKSAADMPTFCNDADNLRFDLFPWVERSKPTKPIDMNLYKNMDRSDPRWNDKEYDFVETDGQYVHSSNYPSYSLDPFAVVDSAYDAIFGK